MSILFYGNESQLNNAILNLCLNARDAIKGQGSIELTLTHRQLQRFLIIY